MKKKLVVAASAALPVLSALAEDPSVDTSAAEGIITSGKTALQSVMSSATPAVTAIVLAGLGIWAAIKIIRLLKRAFSSGS